MKSCNAVPCYKVWPEQGPRINIDLNTVSPHLRAYSFKDEPRNHAFDTRSRFIANWISLCSRRYRGRQPFALSQRPPPFPASGCSTGCTNLLKLPCLRIASRRQLSCALGLWPEEFWLRGLPEVAASMRLIEGRSLLRYIAAQSDWKG
jgi:hypothetical protein